VSGAAALSCQVVSEFLQSRLVGEGNVLRHLELLGYRLGYSQSPLMEYPFAITNLAVDLRDGLRLIKVAEVLTGGWMDDTSCHLNHSHALYSRHDIRCLIAGERRSYLGDKLQHLFPWQLHQELLSLFTELCWCSCCCSATLLTTGDTSLLQQARFPCDRRPMQLHNTNLALSALQAAGVQLQALPTTSGLVSLKPEDIIDGDRERTLSLLWTVARTLQLSMVLRVPALKAEVQRVLARTRVSGRRPLLPATSTSSRSPLQQQVPLAVYMHDELLSTLQEWVQAVCAAFDVSVQNFTTAFGDGVVLCLLVSPAAVDACVALLPCS